MELENIPGKKVLVTGATGFVGGHLTKRLSELGINTRVLARASSEPAKVHELKRMGAEVCLGDITDRDAVNAAVAGVDYVFHLAALFRQAKHADDVYYSINVGGTKNIFEAAKANGVKRVVHCSTVGVHSHIPKPPANEAEAYRPGDIYQETKCEGEKLAQKYIRSGEVEGVIIRPAMIWGEGDRRLLKLFKGVKHGRFPIVGDGRTLTHWVYVKDLVNGFLLAADRPEAAGQTYIIAGRRAVPIEELVGEVARVAGVKPLPFKIPALPVQLLGTLTEVICKPIGVEPPIYRRRVDFFTKDRSFDTTKAIEELGYQPEQDFGDEVKNIYQWYDEHGWLN